ncbi:hypothetical protein [Haloplanus salilacus]|uniref:hypothetical protein n=1 Tax=Haloplanus salilacus TaxID=2949994 RepID=UPI0030CAA19A
MKEQISRSDVCAPKYIEPPSCNPPLGVIKKGRLWVVELFRGGTHDGETLSTHDRQMDALRAGKETMEAETHPCLLRWHEPDSVGTIYWNPIFEDLTVQYDPLQDAWVVVPEASHFVFGTEDTYQAACEYALVVQEEYDFKHLTSYDQNGTAGDTRDHRFLRHDITTSGVRFTNARAPVDTDDSDETADSESVNQATPSALGASVPDVTKVTIIDDDGPLHRYESPWADERTARIVALAPDYRSIEPAVETMATIITSWNGLADRPYVATVLEFGLEPAPWIVYQSHADTLAERGHDLPAEKRLSLLDDISSALMAARQTEMSTIGVRPENIQLVPDQSGYRGALANWGVEWSVGKVTEKPFVTPFTAPEQIDGTVSPRTSVYQLGALAYWLFCEAKPFTDTTNLPEAIKMGDLIAPTVAGELPDAAAEVLTTAMSPTPENRYDDVGAFYSAFCKSF